MQKNAIQLRSSKRRVWSFKTVFHHLYFLIDTLLTCNKQVLVTEWWEWYWAQNEFWQHFPDRKYINAEPAFIWTISGITWTSQYGGPFWSKSWQQNAPQVNFNPTAANIMDMLGIFSSLNNTFFSVLVITLSNMSWGAISFTVSSFRKPACVVRDEDSRYKIG